ncbi:hypothetical protein HOH45_00680 [bacterium]|nr:hypothetical protein [bacterium]
MGRFAPNGSNVIFSGKQVANRLKTITQMHTPFLSRAMCTELSGNNFTPFELSIFTIEHKHTFFKAASEYAKTNDVPTQMAIGHSFVMPISVNPNEVMLLDRLAYLLKTKSVELVYIISGKKEQSIKQCMSEELPELLKSQGIRDMASDSLSTEEILVKLEYLDKHTQLTPSEIEDISANYAKLNIQLPSVKTLKDALQFEYRFRAETGKKGLLQNFVSQYCIIQLRLKAVSYNPLEFESQVNKANDLIESELLRSKSTSISGILHIFRNTISGASFFISLDTQF